MKGKYLSHLVVLLFCYLALMYGYFYSSRALYEIHDRRDLTIDIRKWAVPTPLLKILVGEFKGVWSDLLTMEAASQLGTRMIRDRKGQLQVIQPAVDWDTIVRILQHSLALDPSFKQTYRLIQGHLAWEDGYLPEAMKMLKISQNNRPWDWQPLHFQAFNTYYFLGDYGKAGKMMIEASMVPDAPQFLAVLGGRLAHKGGETAGAINLMKSMLADKEETEPGYQEIVERLEALEGVLVIEKAIKQYSNMFFGHVPEEINLLKTTGILQSIPVNPYNVEYCIDQNGTVFFDRPNCRRIDN